MLYTLTSFNEISSKADICVGDMEHTHQGMLLRAHTHTHTHATIAQIITLEPGPLSCAIHLSRPH